MEKTSWWESHRPSKRRLVQLYSALLYNAHVRGFIEGEIYTGNAKYACVPGFNCYSCPGAIGACPLGSLQNALGSLDHTAGWYMMGILLLFGIIAGRTICGWICPLGLLQELLHKIPTPKLRKNSVTRALSYLKYVVLAVFAVALPLWYGLKYDIPLPGFCKYICPAGTFEGAISLLAAPSNKGLFAQLGILFTRKFIILLVIGLACVFCYRSFCRFLCPLGAIYSLFNRFCVVGVRVDESKCTHCGLCAAKCGMDVRHVGDHECIHCAKCMNSCAAKAISMKAGKITLISPDTDKPEVMEKQKSNGKKAWTAAIVVLVLALVWFNVLDPSLPKSVSAAGTEPDTSEVQPDDSGTETADKWHSDKPIGYEVGDQLADFSITCVDGSEFHLADERGKITFINLWATYCTPCVMELPYFSEFAEKYKDDVAVLAVHDSLASKGVDDFLSDKTFAFRIAVDSKDKAVWNVVNGTTTLPQTIVLNRKGEVIYNERRSVTPEMLEALYSQAAATTEAPDETAAASPA